MGSRNNLHVASSAHANSDVSGLGGAVRVKAAYATARYNRETKQLRRQNQHYRDGIIRTKRFRETVEFYAKKHYGNKKTSRRVDINPELHLAVEVREILERKAFPAYSYDQNGVFLTKILDKDDYSRLDAGEYYAYRLDVLSNFDACMNFMIQGFTAALKLTMNHYPASRKKGRLKHMLAVAFVDQINRRSARDVQVGAQYNFIEDPSLLREVSGTAGAMALLDECYDIVERIDAGLLDYEAYNGEEYQQPAAYPAIDEYEMQEFTRWYKDEVYYDLADFFATFDESATCSYDFMASFMMEMKEHLQKMETPFGGNSSSVNHLQNEVRTPACHIEMVVDAKNDIRKKGQILAALAYCVNLAWESAPDSQTLGAWELYRFTVDHWFLQLKDGRDVGPLPDDEALFGDESVLSEIFWNEPDAVAFLEPALAVYSHAKAIQENMEVEYAGGNATPMWNFKRGEWWDGQNILYGAAVAGGDFHMTVDYMYSEVRDYRKAAVEHDQNMLKPYRPSATPG